MCAKRNAGVAALVCSIAMLGAAQRAFADESPVGCSQNGSGASIGFVVAPGVTEFQHGTEVCFQVSLFNTCLNCCDVTELDSQLVLPNGSVVPITVDAVLNFGDSYPCPGSPQCATPSNCTIPGEVGYRYVVSHANEHGTTGVNCPPTPAPGTGEFSAFFLNTAGTVHASIHVGPALCQALALPVEHACCAPCSGICTSEPSAATCPPPSVFTPASTCSEVTCTPLNCDDGKSCTNPDICNPATGTCINPPVNAKCNDNITCTNPDLCAPSNPLSDPLTGCVITPVNAKCLDLLGCTADSCSPGAPLANPVTGCLNTPTNSLCNDFDLCTSDVCVPGTGCVNTPTGVCCDPLIGCPEDPTGCFDAFCDPATLLCRVVFQKGAVAAAEEFPTEPAVQRDLDDLFAAELREETGQVAGLIRESVSEKGSILYYSKIELKWNAAGAPIQDTFLTLVNDLNQEVCVEWHFINGDDPSPAIPGAERAHPGWNMYDCNTCYTPHENIYMSMLRGGGSLGCQPFTALDPGPPPGRPDPDGLPGERILRGYAIAIAVDRDGIPISWNHLTGHADIVNYSDLSAWEYNTYAFQCLATATNGAPCGTGPTELLLNGAEYDFAWDQLLFDFYGVGSEAFTLPPSNFVTINTDLTLYPVSVDLRSNFTNTSGPVLTRADITIWNENEDDRTGTSRCIDCWDQTLLCDYDPPNNFLINLLGTDKGYARINGVRADSCEGPGLCCCPRRCSNGNNLCEDNSWCGTPPNQGTCGLFGCFDPDCDEVDFRRGTPDRDCSEDAALLGLSNKWLFFSGLGLGRTDAGMTLVGIGTQAAVIRRDLPSGTAPQIPRPDAPADVKSTRQNSGR